MAVQEPNQPDWDTFSEFSSEEEEEEEELQLTPLIYSDVCPSLFPTHKPAGYPHIIDVSDFDEETDQSQLRAVDGVATLLWKWKPEEAKKFFDLGRKKYEFSVEDTRPVNGGGENNGIVIRMDDILIGRSGNYVMVRTFTISVHLIPSFIEVCLVYLRGFGIAKLGFRRDYEFGKDWDVRVDFVIEDDGKWKAVASSMGTNPEIYEGGGKMFAAALIYHKRWNLRQGMKITTYVAMTKEEADAEPESDDSDDRDDSDDGFVGYVAPRVVETEYIQ